MDNVARRQFLRSSALFLAASLVACGGTPLQIMAQRGEVFLPGAARVVVKEIRDHQINVDVFNQTGYPLVVYRDAFLLSTAEGMRARLPGGVSSVYTIQPGGVHQVNVRYDLHGLRRGEQAALIFQNALVVNGQPLPIEPLPLVIQ